MYTSALPAARCQTAFCGKAQFSINKNDKDGNCDTWLMMCSHPPRTNLTSLHSTHKNLHGNWWSFIFFLSFYFFFFFFFIMIPLTPALRGNEQATVLTPVSRDKGQGKFFLLRRCQDIKLVSPSANTMHPIHDTIPHNERGTWDKFYLKSSQYMAPELVSLTSSVTCSDLNICEKQESLSYSMYKRITSDDENLELRRASRGSRETESQFILLLKAYSAREAEGKY